MWISIPLFLGYLPTEILLTSREQHIFI
uniref:Uncharacterized protein n=1 Tax=Rhizophora mucronata TaxID=61149 RepID=A0A2P2NDL7_RHIMU